MAGGGVARSGCNAAAARPRHLNAPARSRCRRPLHAAAQGGNNSSSDVQPQQQDGAQQRPCPLPPPPDLGGATPSSRWNAASLAYLGDSVWEVSGRRHTITDNAAGWESQPAATSTFHIHIHSRKPPQRSRCAPPATATGPGRRRPPTPSCGWSTPRRWCVGGQTITQTAFAPHSDGQAIRHDPTHTQNYTRERNAHPNLTPGRRPRPPHRLPRPADRRRARHFKVGRQQRDRGGAAARDAPRVQKGDGVRSAGAARL